MEIKPFYTTLFIVTLLAGGTLWALYQFAHLDAGFFPLFGLTFFFIFSLLIFHLGRASVVSSDKNRFTAVVMGMIFLKLVLTLFIVIGYDRLVTPIYIHHIISFLISYLFFTVFEVYFMSKLSRWKA